MKFNNHPLIIKLIKLNRSQEQINDVIKLLCYAKKRNINVVLEPDKDDIKNPGFYDHENKKIAIDPKYVKFTKNMIFVLLHELGHVIQLNNKKSEYTLTLNFPAAMNADGFYHSNGEKKSLKRSNKYWIDLMGFELEAWGIARNLADKLKIKINNKDWTKLKYLVMRRLITWFK